MRTSIYFLAFAFSCCVANTSAGQPLEYTGTPVSNTVFVTFPDGGSAFRPTHASLETLATAGEAALITVRGRTSTLNPTLKDEALAFARAASARAYLISKGVSPLKIMVNYASAADFVADNSTALGRIENQRVEIELIYVHNDQY